jgi:tRNA(fMet)-specific endonuclease VapC
MARTNQIGRARISHRSLLLASTTALPFDELSARRCGELKDSLRRAGTPLFEPDLQIASIALYHVLPLVTHNQRHFARVPGLKVLDWIV